MQILVGGILGLLVGAGVWLLAQRLLFYYEAQLDEQPLTERQRVLFEPRGAVSLAAALTLAGMALWGAYVGWRSAGWPQLAAALLFTGLLVTVSLVDFQTRRIPNGLVLALLGWAVVQVIWLGQPTSMEAGLGLALAGGIFMVIGLIGRGALGTGDVKLAAALGAVLGFPLAMTGLLVGVVLGGLAALVLLVTRRVGRKDPIAYGPYLALGAWIVWTRAFGLWPW
jgi:leader peptidase (prepilin peptidase)/N-methyltransferase